MTNTVQLKRSSVANSVPGAANLAPGELAINYADGNLFYKDSGNAVTVIASNKFSSVTGNVTGGNVLTGGLISAAGNITANISSFFIGNGSLLTGISGGSGASISNGTSNVTVVSSGGNVTVGVGGTGNVAVFATTGEFITGLLSVSGNVTGGNFITGPGGNISGADVITANTVSASANILTGGFISATGNITGGNILGGANVDATTHTGTTVSITGNVTANNGMFTNIVNVASHTGTVVSVTGNVTANNGIFGNRVLVGSGNLSSPSIAFSADGQTDTGFYWISDGVIGIATNGSARANFNATGLDITGIMSASGNVTGGNLLTGGFISAGANVTGEYFFGNGSQLSGLAASYGNANVVANLAALGSNPVSTTGNITGGNLLTGGLISAVATITGGNLLTDGFVSAIGNITANTGSFFIGNGQIITGILFSNTSDATTASLTVDDFYLSAVTALDVSAANSSGYQFDQYPGTNPAIYAVAGSTLAFRLAVTGHPFLIQSSGANYSTGLNHVTTLGTVTTAASAQGQVAGTLYWKIPGDISGTYTYQCSIHGGMVGNIVVSSPTVGSFASLTVTGNITGGNILTGGLISATANVTANNGMFTTIVNTASFTGAVVSVSGNITSGNIITGNGSGGNLTGANVISATTLCATGNITGGNILGGANVNATTHTGTTVSVTADVTGGNLLTGGFISATGNITGGNILGGANVNATLHTGTTVSVTGNITSGNVNTGNITITGDLISSLGATLTIDPATVGNAGLVVINGNLQVNGTTTTINSNVVSTNDLTINFANNAINASAANGGGIEVGPIGSPFITWLYNDIANVWTSSNGISVVGNITGGNVLGGANVNATTHTGTTVSVTANVTGGNLLTGGFVSANGNIDGGNLSGTNIVGTLTTASQTNITSVGTLGSLTVTANTTSGNLLTGGFVSAIGNITANTGSFFIGNGSLLTGTGTPLTVSQYTSGNTSNAISNVSTLQFDTTTGFIVTSIGNNAALISMGSSFKTWEVTGQANLVAVGEDIVQFVAGTGISITTNAVSTPQQISFTATYGNSNVDNYLPTYTGNLISLTGPVTTTANITGGNILTGGLISATGNITANTGSFFIGDGSLLTGIAASYGNANVVANLAALGTNPVSTTGNITGSYIFGNGSQLTGIVAVSSYGNANVVANLAALGTNPVSTTGNITGSYIFGNGSQLTDLPAGNYSNANVASYLPTYTGSLPSLTGALSTTGNVTGNYILGNGSQLTGLATTSVTTDSFTGNGSTTTFTLSTTPSSINATTVNYNGVTLLRSSYSVNVANVIFSNAPANNSNIEITTLTSGSSGSTGSSLIWNIASSNATMTASNGYFVDTSSSAKTMTLPASVTLGDTIQINDLAGTFATNNLTVARNGQNIQGVANNLVVSTNQSSFDLVYSNSTYGWKILGL